VTGSAASVEGIGIRLYGGGFVVAAREGGDTGTDVVGTPVVTPPSGTVCTSGPFVPHEKTLLILLFNESAPGLLAVRAAGVCLPALFLKRSWRLPLLFALHSLIFTANMHTIAVNAAPPAKHANTNGRIAVLQSRPSFAGWGEVEFCCWNKALEHWVVRLELHI
jgi:hypothetical protein